MIQDSNNNQEKSSTIPPKRGRILISEPFLLDPFFERSVILLIDHDDTTGSMGFVVNKPMQHNLNDYFSELKYLEPIPLFAGGPVNTDRIFYIHTLGDLIPNTYPVAQGIYFDGDFEIIKPFLFQENMIHERIKFFLGYAGWGEHQLKEEIAKNTWVVGRANTPRIMKTEGDICWKKSLIDLGGRYKTWANFPKRPYMN